MVASLSPKRTVLADPPTETKVFGPRRTTKGTPRREGDCLAIIHSRDETLLGRRIELGSVDLLIGRGDGVGLSLLSESVSRRHARIFRDGPEYVVEDLGSTNGTYVNDHLVDSAALRRGDQIKVGDTILKYLTGDDVENQYHEAFRRLAMHDGLTDIFNKRYFVESLRGELSRAARHDRPLSLILFDIDHFKRINDEYGHLAGDAILKEMASRVGAQLRPSDVFARYGGEEFVILLPDTPVDGGHAVAEKIRQSIESRDFVFEGVRIAVTSSFGVADRAPGLDEEGLVKLADERLYRAKRRGRNRVIAA
jgi:two-component system, cell cycle response regulator